MMDMGGAWPWKAISQDKFFYLQSKLVAYEKVTWAEAYGNKGSGLKYIATEQLSNEARKRLEALKLDDVDGLYEFTLSNKERVWGIRVDNVCYLLWWDPNHTVCPSTKKHT